MSSTSSIPFRRRLSATSLILLLASCAGAPPAPRTSSLELDTVPFFPQTRFQCGPAALATLINHAGRARVPEELIDAVYVEGLRGSLQAELLAATRREGLLPYPVANGAEGLLVELEAGRPVLVLQNLGLPRWPVWHYAVIVGYDATKDAFVLRSGNERRRLEPRARFLRSWTRAGSWGFSALRPGTLPVAADPVNYVRTLAATEPWLDEPARVAGHAAALSRWPDHPLVLFAAATASVAAKRWDEAELHYRRLLTHVPDDAAARNNLAHVLAERGCVDAGLREAERALADAEAGPLAEVVRATLDELHLKREDAAPAQVVCGVDAG